MIRLAGLFRYPVKGLRGTRLDTAAVEFCGVAGDRRWMVVDAAGRFLSQRQLPGMARIEATLRDGGLTLGLPAERIAVAPSGPNAERIAVTVWRSRLEAPCPDPEADRWLSDRLGTPCRLAYLDDPRARPVEPRHAQPGDHVSFADGFPLLVTSVASLAALNNALRHPVGMERFRPNLVVAGAAAWAEDGWRRLRIGGMRFRAPKPCERCAVITVDQSTGAIPHPGEPLRTLGRLNRHAEGVVFGCNLIPEQPGGLSVGDPVEVVE